MKTKAKPKNGMMTREKLKTWGRATFGLARAGLVGAGAWCLLEAFFPDWIDAAQSAALFRALASLFE